MTTPTLPRLLVIDDEVQIQRLLHHTLGGGEFQLHAARTGQLGLGEAASLQPDAIILDLGLPDLDGLEVLRRLREWSTTPVLVLTVRDGEEDIIAALDAGADDYLTKPFRGRELHARIRAVLRRGRTATEPAVVRFGEIEVDLAARLVRRGGQELHLTAREYALLCLLVQHRGKVVTHRQILRELWGPNAEQKTNYLRAYIIRLRQKLEPKPGAPAHLKTESGIGYRLIAD
jgi:two-component system KDP operon response regulator KdpE